MVDAYSQARTALGKRLICTYFQNEHQLVVSNNQGPPWPGAGNSFWISHQQGVWYLCTWVPTCYRIPSSSDVVEVCAEFVAFGSSAQAAVPQEIVEKYSLIEVSHQEASKLFDWDASGGFGRRTE
jgi:hypothetical protein